MYKQRTKLDFISNKKLIAIIIVSLIFGLTSAFSATSVSKNGITWTFSKDYQVGQYVNGDYWVLDSGSGVTVNSVSPSPSGSSNGSVINPAGGTAQGYDGRIDGYNSSLRVSFPRTLTAGQSLVSSQSRNASSNGTDLLGASVQPAHCYLERAAVLTVVSSVPNAQSFRPPFVGTSKPTYLASSLNRSLLLKLPLSAKPSASYVNEVAGYFKEVWLDHKPVWVCRMMHPIKNMPNYGREIGIATSRAACLLLLDYTDAQLEPLLINFVQTGIDLYHMSLLSNNWPGEGGHANGRKWPILFAGMMLNNNAMKNPTCNFGEDDQTYYGVTASRNSGQQYVAYWGANCVSSYQANGCTGSGTKDCRPSAKNGDACQDYRNCCTSYTWVGYALAAQLMGAENIWNHGAFFDYVDRWMGYGSDPRVGSGDWVQPGETSTSFISSMWNQYRSSVGSVTPPPTPTNLAPTANAGQDQTVQDTDGNGSQSVTLNSAGSSDSDGTISSYTWLENNASIASGASPTVNLTVGTHTITLRVTDNGGLTATDIVVITVTAPTQTDTQPPTLGSIDAQAVNKVKLIFNEALNTTVAQTAANYSIDGITISSAVYSGTDKTVTLTTSNHAVCETHTLTLRNIKDSAGNTMPTTSEKYTYDPGLIGIWNFSETAGTTASDYSGRKNNGTLVNGPTWTGSGQLQFDGVNDALQVPTTGLTASAGSITVQAYIANSQNIQYFFGHSVGAWSSRIQLYMANGQLGIGMGGTHFSASNIRAMELNKWYSLALTWNGTNYTAYLDGAQIAAGTYSGLTSLASFADFGNDGCTSSRTETLNGKIDRCRLYNRALSAAEIASIAEIDSPFAFAQIGDKEVDEGTALTFTVETTNPATVVSLVDNNLPSTPSFVNKIFNWTPGYNHAGTYECTFTAQDGLLEDSETITVKVNNVNRPPVISSITAKSVVAGQALSFAVAASDSDGDTVTCTASGLPSGASFNGTTFQWTSSSSQAGNYTVTFTASDGQLTDTEPVAITVTGGSTGGGTTVTVTIDNSTTNCSYTGWWGVSGGTDPYGTNSLWGRDGAKYTWTFKPTVTGNYDVSMWWSGQSNRPTSAPLSIAHASGTANVNVNQLENAGKWNSLGSFNFTAVVSYRITITAPAVSSTCADALKFTLNSSTQPPVDQTPEEPVNVTMLIDNSTSDCTSTGWWGVSGGTDPYGNDSLWGRDGAKYTWTFRPTVSGNYDVSMWWSGQSNRPSSVPVQITHASGTTTVNVNQLQDAGKWNSLGQFSFAAGNTYKVTITAPAVASTCADAIRLDYLD
ncbi:MAG: LamG-like jellyroll fold domain-containing protein [Phycisphaerales bacterium]